MKTQVHTDDATMVFPFMTAQPFVNRKGMALQREIQLLRRCIDEIRDACDDQREVIEEIVIKTEEEIKKK